jgi:GAF domain-containing protein
MKLRRRKKPEQPPRAEDTLPPVQPLSSELLAEVQAEIRLIRTMASTLRHVDRVRLAAQQVCELALELLGVEMALVNVVTDTETVVIASSGDKARTYRPGVAGGFDETYCPIVVGTGKPVAIESSRFDPRVAINLATTRDGIQSYLGVPLRTEDDFVIGTLCVCGCEPRKWSDHDEAILTSLSNRLMSLEAEALRTPL